MSTPLAPPAELWRPLLSEREQNRLDAAGFGQRCGIGDRPALLIIDAQNYMTGPLTPADSTDYPSSCGEQARMALPRIAALAACMRRRGDPVIYTRFELAADGSDAGVYQLKRPLLREPGWCLADSPGAQIADPVRPSAGDLVLVKTKPSPFRGTSLPGLLIARKVDTLIITGGSTSNCVRATAVDAASLNYRVLVPAECVFDRVDISHRITLFDIDRQYGDVVRADDLTRTLATALQDHASHM